MDRFILMSISISSRIADQEAVENGFQHAELLSASNDDHGGVIVDMKEPMDPNVFASLLRASMSQWRLQVLILSNFLQIDLNLV